MEAMYSIKAPIMHEAELSLHNYGVKEESTQHFQHKPSDSVALENKLYDY